MYESRGEARRARRGFHLPGIAHPAGQRLPDAAQRRGLIDATGGPGAVKAAYSSGKPAWVWGPGNTPVYLEKTADLTWLWWTSSLSKTFDNGTICASEQTVVIDDEIYDRVLKKFAELGAHICNEKETELLARTVIDPETGFMQPMAVGQKATDIARFVGFR
jgi:acetaldehyde dehydrogenase / alcohol dehydrogenase